MDEKSTTASVSASKSDSGTNAPKSKAQLKAERRAIQVRSYTIDSGCS